MFAKPEARKRVKARSDRAKAAARQRCVAAVWKRAERFCEVCHVWLLKPSETDNPLAIGHVHEIIPRSRGGDPTDPDNCILACPKCHAREHGQRVAD